MQKKQYFKKVTAEKTRLSAQKIFKLHLLLDSMGQRQLFSKEYKGGGNNRNIVIAVFIIIIIIVLLFAYSSVLKAFQ